MIERLIPESKLRMIDLLRDGPRAIEDLASELGITTSGARQQVTALCKVGVVEVQHVRRYVGRPRHMYVLNATAARELRYVGDKSLLPATSEHTR